MRFFLGKSSVATVKNLLTTETFRALVAGMLGMNRVSTRLSSLRLLSRSSIVFAQPKKAAPKRQAQGKVNHGAFNPNKNKEAKPKVKHGGMTHLAFKDAVTALNFNKLAPELDLEPLSHNLEPIISKVVKYDPATLSKLEQLETFQRFQHHELFREPVSLVSDNTIKLNNEFIENLKTKSSRDLRLCLLGDKGSGKSTLLAQNLALASSKYGDNVILLHLSSAENIGNGTSDYIYNESLGKYQQPMLTKRWIFKIKRANQAIFSKLKLSTDLTFTSKRVEHTLKKDEHTIADFLRVNIDFGKFAPTTAFQILTRELLYHSKDVPILVSVDNVNALIDHHVTTYKSRDFVPLKTSDFEMGDFFIKVLSGEINFEKGGILAANNNSLGNAGNTLNVSLGLAQHNPYAKENEFDLNIANRLLSNGGLKPFFVKNLSKEESKSLLEFYRESGVMNLRDYPSKKVYKSLDADAEPVPTHTFDPELHFEKIASNYYNNTSGNPKYLLNAIALDF